MKNCIILGSGRSGTSAVAGALITTNPSYYSGGDFIPPRTSNPDGTFEPVSIRKINEEILAQVVPERHTGTPNDVHRQIPTQWQRWLARIPLETRIASTKSIDDQIKEHLQNEPYCLKDPRFSYTLNVWRPHLDNCVFVCMFRDPAETAKSIMRFTQEFELMKDLEISYDQTLEAWTLLNRHILEKHYTKEGGWLFLHLNQLFSNTSLDRLVEMTGANVNRLFINSKRIRTRYTAEVPPSTEKVYTELCRLADYKLE